LNIDFVVRSNEYTVDVIAEVHKKRENLRGMKMTYEAPFLRHFTAKFEYA